MHTAFLTQVELLKKKKQIILVNSNNKADITHIHSLGPFALFKLLTSKNTVISSHLLPDTFIGSFKGGIFLQRPLKKYLHYCYNKADIVFALSEHAKKKLKEMGVTTRIELVPNPLNANVFKPDKILRETGRDEFGIKKDGFVVLGVGHLIKRKGLEDFIAVARTLPEVTFLWAGTSIAPLLNSATEQQKILLKSLPENVELLGHVPYKKMPALYNASDVLFFPSYQEITPMVIIEAAACGLPLVLRDLPEYKGSFLSAYLGGTSIGAFSDIIGKLVKDKKYLDRYKSESLKLALRFNSEMIGEKMMAYYNSMINSNGKTRTS